MRNNWCQFLQNFSFALTALLLSVTPVSAEKLTGTPIGTSQSKAAYAFDGSASTTYTTEYSVASFAWVGLDLGKPYIINKVGWMPSSTYSTATLLGVFQGANLPDFSDAVPIWVNTETGRPNQMTYADVKCSLGFRYVRYVGPNNSYCRVAEIEFYGEPGEGDEKAMWQITNLPTVSINTVNGEIPYDKEHEISSTVIIISNNGSKVLKQSKTGIRERGNGSRTFPKKPWRIKFDKKQNVLDAPAKAKKWTLINNYGDKTLMRNMLAFDVARKMGMEWVPYCTPVDVVLNGEYKGCYQLSDQVEVNDGRLEIDEMTPEDNSGEALTGGYFVEVDAYATEEPVYFKTAYYKMPITVKSPDDDKITSQQLAYITNYFNNLESLLTNTDPEKGYRSIFDTHSFIQHMLVNEMAGNTDCYWSTFMYKRRGNPLIYTGPVWDFDLAFENDSQTYPIVATSGNGFLWNTSYSAAANGMKNFTRQVLISDPRCAEEILNVWAQARKAGLTAEWLQSKVDEYAALLAQSQKLNFMRWPIMNQYVHRNPRIYGTYEGECDNVKSYISQQIQHLDRVIGYDPDAEVPDIKEPVDYNVSITYAPNTNPKSKEEDRVDIDHTILSGVNSHADLNRRSVSMGAWVRMSTYTTASVSMVGNTIAQYGGLNHNNANGLMVLQTTTDGRIALGGFGVEDAVQLAIGSKIYTDQVIPLNEWHYVAVALDFTASEIRIYFDGNKIKTQPLNGRVFDGTRWSGDQPYGFGFGGLTFNGSMDDIHIVDGAITDTEAFYLYTDRAEKVPNLVGWYTFDEVVRGTTGTFANQVASKGNYNAVYYTTTGTASDAGGSVNISTTQGKANLSDITAETQRIKRVFTPSITIMGANAEVDGDKVLITASVSKTDVADDATVTMEYSLDEKVYTPMKADENDSFSATINISDFVAGEYEVILKAAVIEGDEDVANNESSAAFAVEPILTVTDLNVIPAETGLSADIEANLISKHFAKETAFSLYYRLDEDGDSEEMPYDKTKEAYAATITGLSSNSQYTVYVFAVSDNEVVSEEVSETFSTPEVDGIVDVEADIAEGARYFNLQGIEITNPASGNVYIRLSNNIASKVLVK